MKDFFSQQKKRIWLEVMNSFLKKKYPKRTKFGGGEEYVDDFLNEKNGFVFKILMQILISKALSNVNFEFCWDFVNFFFKTQMLNK